MPWTPYKGSGDGISSTGSRGGSFIWEEPSLTYTIPSCGPSYGVRKGGGVVRVIGSPDCNKYNRGLKLDASFKGSYHESTNTIAQIGFDHFAIPMGLWGPSLIEAGWVKQGKEWIKYNQTDGKLEAATSQSISYGLKCPGDISAQNLMNAPMVKISIGKKQYTVRDDCSTLLLASETFKISFDPKISANFLQLANDYYQAASQPGSTSTSDMNQIMGDFTGDYILSGVKALLGPAFNMLSGVANTPTDTDYYQSGIYSAFSSLIGDVPINGGLMIGE